MGFQGWTADAIDFYDGLEEDNSKAYWQARKGTYEQAVRRPMEELLAELAGQFGPGRIFRPNRDVRFSADKSPPRIVAAARDAGIEITAHDRLKTAPRGYPKDHPRIGLLCLKGLIAWRQWPTADWLATPEAKSRVVEFLRQAEPLQNWLDTHVGPSKLPAARR